MMCDIDIPKGQVFVHDIRLQEDMIVSEDQENQPSCGESVLQTPILKTKFKSLTDWLGSESKNSQSASSVSSTTPSKILYPVASQSIQKQKQRTQTPNGRSSRRVPLKLPIKQKGSLSDITKYFNSASSSQTSQ